MAGAFLVTLDRTKSGHTLKSGADAVVVFATDATQAKQMAASKYDGDGQAWITDGTATEVTAVAAGWIGWTFKINIYGPDTNESVEVTGAGADNTIDEIGALLVTALNALDDIAGAEYNGTTNVLTVAQTTDGIGDHNIEVTITPPGGYSGIASLVGTIVDGGAAGDAITLALPADALGVPSVPVGLKQV